MCMLCILGVQLLQEGVCYLPELSHSSLAFNCATASRSRSSTNCSLPTPVDSCERKSCSIHNACGNKSSLHAPVVYIVNLSWGIGMLCEEPFSIEGGHCVEQWWYMFFIAGLVRVLCILWQYTKSIQTFLAYSQSGGNNSCGMGSITCWLLYTRVLYNCGDIICFGRALFSLWKFQAIISITSPHILVKYWYAWLLLDQRSRHICVLETF